jgi:hypothetical protein
MTRILTCFLISLISYQLNAQIIPFITEPVKQSDFSPVSPLITPGLDYIVLQTFGETVLDATVQTDFFTEYHYFRRVLILNANGLENAKGQFTFNSENDSKKLKTVHIATYNLINGEIVKTELDRKDLFIEDPKEDIHNVRFAYPNAKAGSILEFEYTIHFGYRTPQNWYFQEDHPVLHSSYSVSIPSIWNFIITLQNQSYLTSVKKDSIAETIHTFQDVYEHTMVFTFNWTFDNIPAMKTEPFVSTIENYIGCIKFQPNVRPTRPGHSELLINDWQWVSNRLLKNDDFGLQITDPEPWVYKLAKTIVQPDDGELEKSKKIYAYVRDHLKADSRGCMMERHTKLNDIYKAGRGNVAEINLLLIALLRTQKLNAEGVILATKDKGLTNVNFPIVENFNYAICKLEISGRTYYLDASNRTMGFGKLPSQCYNGQARVIDEKPYSIFLSPDSIRESSTTYVVIEYDSSKKILNLEWTEHPGYYLSSVIREAVFESKNSQDAYFNTYIKDKQFPGIVDSFSITHIKDLEEQILLNYKEKIKLSDMELFYFNPITNGGLNKNPFVSAERQYPVEFPYIFDDTYLLTMEVPAGYEVEELPKSVRVKLNDNDGIFEYLIQKNENTIQLKYVLNIKRATFDPEDYNNLRDFYTMILKKEAENIVFKKMKRP